MTLKAQFVSKEYLHLVFPKVEGLIKSGLEHTDDCTIDQAKVFLANGSWELLAITDDKQEIHGVFMYSVSNDVNDRTATIIAAGGKNIINNEVFDQVCDHFRYLGATRVQALARESAARLYKRIGLEDKAILTEKRL